MTSTLLCLATVALTASPAIIPVQGALSSTEGTPVEGELSVQFSLYATASGPDTPLWSESQQLTFSQGLFTTYLGLVEPLNLGLFEDTGDLWLGIAIGSDPEMERVRLGSTPYAAYAEYCGHTPAHTHTVDSLPGFARSGQSCSPGSLMTGIDALGFPECGPGNSYSGLNFALSGKTCDAGYVMTGVGATGMPVCQPASGEGSGGATYSGADFALSGQTCPAGHVMRGIGGTGLPLCVPDAVSSSGGSDDSLAGSGTTNRLALFKNSDTLESSMVTQSSNRIGINDTSPSRTLDVKGDLQVTGDFYWGGNAFSTSSCLVIGGTSCSTACSKHSMTCYKAFRMDEPSTSTSCSQSGFKFCCCRN